MQTTLAGFLGRNSATKQADGFGPAAKKTLTSIGSSISNTVKNHPLLSLGGVGLAGAAYGGYQQLRRKQEEEDEQTKSSDDGSGSGMAAGGASSAPGGDGMMGAAGASMGAGSVPVTGPQTFSGSPMAGLGFMSGSTGF